jgi:hypothetical protein
MKSRLCISLGCVQYHWGCQLFESKYLLKGLCNVTEELQEHEYSSVFLHMYLSTFEASSLISFADDCRNC